MTEKRFEGRLNKDNIKFNTLNPVWDNEKETGLNVFEMIDLMNELHEKKEQLKQQRNSCLNDLNKLEIAIEKVQNEFKDNQEVQRAIARIVVIKRELKGDV